MGQIDMSKFEGNTPIVFDRMQGVDCPACENNEPHIHTPIVEDLKRYRVYPGSSHNNPLFEHHQSGPWVRHADIAERITQLETICAEHLEQHKYDAATREQLVVQKQELLKLISDMRSAIDDALESEHLLTVPEHRTPLVLISARAAAVLEAKTS